jgi:hypothetical protein
MMFAFRMVLAMMALATSLFAQVTTGSISGYLYGPSAF